jgi:hypothetical protein
MGVPARLSIKIVQYIPLTNPLTPAMIDLDILGDSMLSESAAVVSSASGAPAFVAGLGDNYTRLKGFIITTPLITTPKPYNKFDDILFAISEVLKETHLTVATGLATLPTPIPPSASLTAGGLTPPTIYGKLKILVINKGVIITPDMDLLLLAIGDFMFNMYVG